MSFLPLMPYLCRALLETFEELTQVPWEYLHEVFRGLMDFEDSVPSFHAALHECGNVYFNHLVAALRRDEKREKLLKLLMDKIPVPEAYRFAWLYLEEGGVVAFQQIVTKGQGWFLDRDECTSAGRRVTPSMDYPESCRVALLQMVESRCKCCWHPSLDDCVCLCHHNTCALNAPVPCRSTPVDVGVYSTMYHGKLALSKLPWKAGFDPEFHVYCVRPGDNWFYSQQEDPRAACGEYILRQRTVLAQWPDGPM